MSETKYVKKSGGLEMPEQPSRDSLRRAFLANQAKMTPQMRAIGQGIVDNLNRNLSKAEADQSADPTEKNTSAPDSSARDGRLNSPQGQRIAQALVNNLRRNTSQEADQSAAPTEKD